MKNVDYAWENAFAKDGDFSNDCTGKSGVTSDTHALIDQGAMTEINARLIQFQE